LSLTTSLKKRTQDIAVFLRKDSRIAVSYKLQFLFRFFEVFVSIAVIYFIGQMLKHAHQSTALQEYGSDYFAFTLVGLAVTSYSRAGLVSVTEEIRQTMVQGTLEAVCMTPLNYPWLLLCSSVWQFLYETLRVIFHFVLGFCLFGLTLHHANWPGALIGLILTILSFLFLSMISCSILIVVKKGDPVNWVLFTLGGLLAGTMFPIQVMPHWLKTLAYCLPLTHSLEIVRRCLLSGTSLAGVYPNILALLLFNALLFPLTIWAVNRCMKKAKKDGAFSTY
jgi:ABC-2 type transport system permease protein